jgi:hypothetical protein
VFNRGATPIQLPPEVNHICDDRQYLEDYQQDFQQLELEVVLDTIALTESHARSTIEVLRR